MMQHYKETPLAEDDYEVRVTRGFTLLKSQPLNIAPGQKVRDFRQPVAVTLVSGAGETIPFQFPIQIDGEGHGAGWLVTGADISSFRTVRLTGPDGRLLATGATPASR